MYIFCDFVVFNSTFSYYFVELEIHVFIISGFIADSFTFFLFDIQFISFLLYPRNKRLKNFPAPEITKSNGPIKLSVSYHQQNKHASSGPSIQSNRSRGLQIV